MPSHVVAQVIFQLLDQLDADAAAAFFFHRGGAYLQISGTMSDEIERLSETSDTTNPRNGLIGESPRDIGHALKRLGQNSEPAQTARRDEAIHLDLELHSFRIDQWKRRKRVAKRNRRGTCVISSCGTLNER